MQPAPTTIGDVLALLTVLGAERIQVAGSLLRAELPRWGRQELEDFALGVTLTALLMEESRPGQVERIALGIAEQGDTDVEVRGS